MEDVRNIIPQLREYLESKDYRGAKSLLNELHPADAVELIDDLDMTESVVVFRLLHKTTAAEVFTDLPPDQQAGLIELFTEKQTAIIFEEMDPDDRAEVLEEFPAGVVREILNSISQAEREMTEKLFGYPENSAGRMMTPEYVEIRPSLTAQEALDHIRRVGMNKESIYTCYVISPYRKIKGVVSLRDLLLAPEGALVKDIMTADPVRVYTHDDQEEAAALVQKYEILALPVVDTEDRLVGIITIDDLVEVIEEEATEDIHRMAGIADLSESYFNTRISVLLRNRIVWLILLMIAQSFSGLILRHFEVALEQMVALIFFIPMLIGSAGNTATQSATLVIRGIAVGEIEIKEIWKVVGREIVMGIFLGLLLGIAGGLIAYAIGGTYEIFITVSIAFMITVAVANVAGAFLPLVFKRLGFDPAISSGPAITTIVDITGLLIYFGVATAILNLTG